MAAIAAVALVDSNMQTHAAVSAMTPVSVAAVVAITAVMAVPAAVASMTIPGKRVAAQAESEQRHRQ